MRLLSVVSAAVLVVLATTTITVWLNSGPPDAEGPDPFGMQTGGQSAWPRVSTLPAANASAVAPASTTAGPQMPPTPTSPAGIGRPSAAYAIRALQGKGGFDIKVTVQNPGQIAWRLVFSLIEDKPVENRSNALVMVARQGSTVIVTPVRTAAPQVVFTLRLPALAMPGSPIASCAVDDGVCAAA